MKTLVALLLLTYVALVQGVAPRMIDGYYYNKVGYARGRNIYNLQQLPIYNQNTNLNYVGYNGAIAGVVGGSNTAVNINNPGGIGSRVGNVGYLSLVPYNNIGYNGVVGRGAVNVNPGYVIYNVEDDGIGDDDNGLYRYNLGGGVGVYRGSYNNNLRRNVYIRRSVYTPNLVVGDGVLGRGIYNNVYNNNPGGLGGVAVVGGGNNNNVYNNNLGVTGGVLRTSNAYVLGGGAVFGGGDNNNVYNNNVGVLGVVPRGGNAYNLGSYTIPNNGVNNYGNGDNGRLLQITKRII